MKNNRLSRTYWRDTFIIGTGYAKRLLGSGIGKRVICLHDTEDASTFREKMLWLKEHYDLVSLDDLLSRPLQTRTLVAVTFDDGYVSWHEVAAPILHDLNIPATFFVCSGFVGLEGEQAKQFIKTRLRRQQQLLPLTKTQVFDLAQCALFEIGGHTVHHVDLGQIRDETLLKCEIAEDQRQLEDWTGQPVRWFAYPFGMQQHISEQAISRLKQLQFSGACTYIPQFVKAQTDRFLVGRAGLDLQASPTLWRAWLSGGYDRLYSLKNKIFTCVSF
ncbi:probable predicted xylanase/chitin deacetylase [Candidatus Vecturithrix granuli]|uniref:Probable predicted xylanase/chitin deacetylase n=1 Tax=Vecturithrix granuli TaxID=1499967 RepID=A0A081BZY8_VECG1|nr:probable predicted xylanase/chitin deacetylase [Candidatus Vecturithrix granuli]